jgi:hypothetical protein
VGTTTWAGFHVDLIGSGLLMTGQPEHVPPLAENSIPEVAQHGYQAYPLVDHVAGKIAATYERYGTRDGLGDRAGQYQQLLGPAAAGCGRRRGDGPAARRGTRSGRTHDCSVPATAGMPQQCRNDGLAGVLLLILGSARSAT